MNMCSYWIGKYFFNASKHFMCRIKRFDALLGIDYKSTMFAIGGFTPVITIVVYRQLGSTNVGVQ